MGLKFRKKKLATYSLATALVFANLGFVAPTSAAYKPGDLASKVKQLQQLEKGKSFTAKDSISASAKASLKASDKVRVIVEVEGQTPVEYATKQGQLYKQLSEYKKNSLISKLENNQKAVKSQLQSKGVNVQYKEHYTTAFNGFSGVVNFGDLDKIESISGVKHVYLANEYNRPEEQPEMTSSSQFTQSHETWEDTGFKGEGMVISIIDTGVDPSHRDFKLTDKYKEGLTQEDISGIVQDNGLKGKFYTDKVPYGYNYFDQNNTILDLGPNASMHGMHVAGIAAANGDESNGGIKGVAPEAQVLAMKVFSNDPNYKSTWSDIYLAAIDDSIKLGADVLNMSLGSVASFYDEDSAEDLAIKRATANGIVCAMSSGNADNLGYGYEDPFAQNPDIGVTGAPGLNPDTISVAASINQAFLFQHNITVDGVDGFTSTGYGGDDWTSLAKANGGSLQLVSLGGDKLGYPDDYKGVDVKGKVVLVPRGTLTFADKTKYASDAGAIGIIVYNKTNGYFYHDQGGWQVPFMMISGAEGATLETAIAAGHTTLHVQQSAQEEMPGKGQMTDFTSWGVTPSLDLKPELTAPGGHIYSTVNGDKYEVMSGTSMASPHVAGGAALVQQYLQSDTRFSQLSVAERTHLAKVLLMNTAKVITDDNGQPYSPRRQGAGMMQTHSAVTTPVYFVNKATGDAKVELKDFQTKQFAMTFTAHNISDKDVTYKVNTDVLTDSFYQTKDQPDHNALIAGNLDGAIVDAPKTITVPAGQSYEFTVNVDLTNAKIPGLDADGNKIFQDLHDKIFVEGSVNLASIDPKVPNLTVPYVGFYGKWDSLQNIDGFQSLGENRYFDLNWYFGGGVSDVLIDNDNYFENPVPDQKVFALSPNGDGYEENINLLPSFLRNASEVQFNILDKDGNQLRRVSAESDVTKTAFDQGLGSFYSYNPNRLWDGTVNGNTVKDGLYYYEIKSVIDYPGAQWQSKKIPVYVDTTAPEVEATYDPDNSTVTWKTTETGTGVEIYGIYVNGDLVGTTDGKTDSYQLTSPPDQAVVEVVALDYAGNGGSDTAAIGDVTSPIVFVDESNPYAYGAYNGDVPVAGYVTDDIGVKAIKVNGKKVDFTYDESTGHYNFETTLQYDQDGPFDVKVEAIDHSNKSYQIARKIYVDKTAPVIDVTAPDRVDKNVDSVTLNINLQDNFNYLEFYVNDNHEFEVPFKSPVDALNPLSKDYQITVPLVEGENTITLRATDLGGNETVKELVINRADPAPQQGWVQDENKVWYFYDEDGSKHTGWYEEQFDENWSQKYYLDPDTGAMHTGWLELDGKRYYFDQDGILQADLGFYVPENKNFYYSDKDGVAQTGIEEFYGQYSYFDAVNGLFRNGWKKVDDTWYLAVNGNLQTGWVQDKGGIWYFFNDEAKMQTGWVNDGKNRYFLKASGEMATGWVKDGGKWYFFAKSGAMQNGWVKNKNKWYHLDESGVMQTGWLKENGNTYYLHDDGNMATGWEFIKGKWYYFTKSGIMAVNTTVDGYKLGKDGAWIVK